MRLLALDTATFSLSAALVDLAADGRVENVHLSAHETGRALHSVLLPGVLMDLLAEAGIGLEAVDALAGGLGPGSFTGLRTGLATLKGLAYGARRPLVGVSSLAAMALEAVAHVADPNALLVPTLDARREQVYAGFYRRDASRGVVPVGEDGPIGPDALAEALANAAGPVVVFGQGALAYPALGTPPEDLPVTPPAAGVARLSAPLVGPYDKAAILSLVPRYVRRSEAEQKLEAGLLRIPGLAPEPHGRR